MKKLIYLFSLTLLLFSCNNDSNAKQEIESKIKQLYTTPEDIYGKEPDAKLLSTDLVNRLQNVQEITKMDQERIKNSDSPTDKPILLEGSVYSSLYEGFTKYTLKNIIINEDTAEAIVDFEYDGTPKASWTDTVILKNQKGWKIENIVFSKKHSGTKDLIEKLTIAKE